MALLAFLKFHPRERLEQQAIEVRNVESRSVYVDGGFAADTAHFTFIGDRQAKGPRQSLIDAIRTGPCVDQGPNGLRIQVRLLPRLRPGLQPYVDAKCRAEFNKQVGGCLAIFPAPKARLGHAREPA